MKVDERAAEKVDWMAVQLVAIRAEWMELLLVGWMVDMLVHLRWVA